MKDPKATPDDGSLENGIDHVHPPHRVPRRSRRICLLRVPVCVSYVVKPILQ
jgi:hypothetical protein